MANIKISNNHRSLVSSFNGISNNINPNLSNGTKSRVNTKTNDFKDIPIFYRLISCADGISIADFREIRASGPNYNGYEKARLDQSDLILGFKKDEEIGLQLQDLEKVFNETLNCIQEYIVENVKLLNCENLSSKKEKFIKQLFEIIETQQGLLDSLYELIFGDINQDESFRLQGALNNIRNLTIGKIKTRATCKLEATRLPNLENLSIGEIDENAFFEISRRKFEKLLVLQIIKLGNEKLKFCRFPSLEKLSIETIEFSGNLSFPAFTNLKYLTLNGIESSSEVVLVNELPSLRHLTIKELHPNASFKYLAPDSLLEVVHIENIHSNILILPKLPKLQTLTVIDVGEVVLQHFPGILGAASNLTINGHRAQLFCKVGIFNVNSRGDDLLDSLFIGLNELRIEDHCLQLDMPKTIIASMLKKPDYLVIFKKLIDLPVFWKGQSIASIKALNDVIRTDKLRNVEDCNTKINPQGLKVIFNTLSQDFKAPDQNSDNFLPYVFEVDRRKWFVANVFEQDLIRTQIAMDGNVYWNRKPAGGFANKEEETLWKIFKMRELLEYCDFNQEKVFKISCICCQTMPNKIKDLQLLLLKNRKSFIPTSMTENVIYKLSKDKNNGEISLTAHIKIEKIKEEEFMPDIIIEEGECRETEMSIPIYFEWHFGISMTREGRWKQYNDGFIKFSFILKEDINEQANKQNQSKRPQKRVAIKS